LAPTTFFDIGHPSAIATGARSNHDAVPKTPSRKVTRDVHEEERDVARALMGTPELDKSRDARKKVEMQFAHLRPTTVSSACACEAFREHVTSFTSQPSCRT
jgi:hypothetical protein